MSLKDQLHAKRAAKKEKRLIASVGRLQKAQALKKHNESLKHGLPGRISQQIGSPLVDTILKSTVSTAQILAFGRPTDREALDSFGKLLALARLSASALIRLNPKDRVLKQLIAALLIGADTWRDLERQYLANGAVYCNEANKNMLEVTAEAILAVFERATERLMVESWSHLNEYLVRQLLGFDPDTGEVKDESAEFDEMLASKGG